MNLLDIKLAGLKSEQKKRIDCIHDGRVPGFYQRGGLSRTLEDAGCDIRR